LILNLYFVVTKVLVYYSGGHSLVR